MAQELGLGGAGMLGAAFGGAPRLREAAYQQERGLLAQAFERAASAQKDQSVAGLNQARLQAQQVLAQKFTAAGMDPAKASLAATAVIAASTSNPNQIIGAGQQLQAQDAGLAGNVQDENVINSARTGKPLDLTRIADNTAFNPSVAPDSQNLAPTDVGSALIEAARARAGASNASAARNRAGIGADKAANYVVEPDASGNMVRVNKLTGQVSPLNTAPNIPLTAPRKGSTPSPDDAAYLQKLKQAFASGKSYQDIAAAAQADGKMNLFSKYFGRQDNQGGQ